MQQLLQRRPQPRDLPGFMRSRYRNAQPGRSAGNRRITDGGSQKALFQQGIRRSQGSIVLSHHNREMEERGLPGIPSAADKLFASTETRRRNSFPSPLRITSTAARAAAAKAGGGAVE